MRPIGGRRQFRGGFGFQPTWSHLQRNVPGFLRDDFYCNVTLRATHLGSATNIVGNPDRLAGWGGKRRVFVSKKSRDAFGWRKDQNRTSFWCAPDFFRCLIHFFNLSVLAFSRFFAQVWDLHESASLVGCLQLFLAGHAASKCGKLIK